MILQPKLYNQQSQAKQNSQNENKKEPWWTTTSVTSGKQTLKAHNSPLHNKHMTEYVPKSKHLYQK